MATEETDDLVSQAPPAKRARLGNDSSKPDPSALIDDMDDFYGTEDKSADAQSLHGAQIQNAAVPQATPIVQSLIPGLGRLGSAPATPEAFTEALPQPTVAEEIKESISPLPVISESNIEMSGTENSTAAAELQPAEKMEVEEITAVNAASDPDFTSHAPEKTSGNKTQSQPVTHALEALLGGLDSTAPKAADPENAPGDEAATGDERPEWEVDSSPYESSSDDSSDDSSEEDSDEDGDNAYKLLSPEEQARILMEGDGGSDDEGGAAKAKGAGGQLRTKNEVLEEVIPKPDVTITPEMRIEELGMVETIVENIILIKAKTSGEYRALESGSVLCLADRSVIGVVSETLGRVQQPLYTVRFTNGGEITEAGLSVGIKVFYSEQHANFALTQVLKAYKGSDASNLHDEEVGAEEIEFSDDEAEAEHKRRLKHKKLEKRGGKMQQNGGQGRAEPHGHPLQQQHLPNGNGGQSYDDAEDDGPYKPLARPIGFADTVGRSEAPQEGAYTPGISNRGRGDFRGRGRGDRGRGRGDRGRGRGGFQDRRDNAGYSQPPQGRSNSGYGTPQQSPASSHTLSPGTALSQSPAMPNQNNFYRSQSQDQYSPQQLMWPQFPQQPFQQPYQSFHNMQNGWPNMAPPPPLPSGAFINPAFFAGNQQGTPNPWQQGQQNGRGRGSSS
jgi:H/ACA ribonucleoprotein complex non-core subunit NAF1